MRASGSGAAIPAQALLVISLPVGEEASIGSWDALIPLNSLIRIDLRCGWGT